MSEAEPKMLFIGLNPPVTSGDRTRKRVELALTLLGFGELITANLFAQPTRDATGVTLAGSCFDGWAEAREALTAGLAMADGVLMGYGLQAPSGAARLHFRHQVDWLEAEIQSRGIPVWEVGGAPRHPSRWQRYTHRMAPGLPFADALRHALMRRGADISLTAPRAEQMAVTHEPSRTLRVREWAASGPPSL